MTGPACLRCKDSGRPGFIRAAGNRIYRECTSCDGKGYHDPDEAMLDAEGRTIAKLEHANRELRRANEELELECLQLRAIKGDYEKRIAELERALFVKNAALRATQEALTVEYVATHPIAIRTLPQVQHALKVTP